MSTQEIKHYEILAVVVVLVAIFAYSIGFNHGRRITDMTTDPPSKHHPERLE